MAKNPRLIDLTGQTFGRWRVVEQVKNHDRGSAKWRCVCACGREGTRTGCKLRSGTTRSCGCVKKERVGALNRTHGLTRTRLYRAWSNMRARCLNPRTTGYKNYGARGIRVSADWSEFQSFRDWAMTSGYTDDLTLERVDVNGDYSPANCTWATKKDQAANKQGSLKREDGRLWSYIAVENGISATAFRTRIYMGWPIELAATRVGRGWRAKAAA